MYTLCIIERMDLVADEISQTLNATTENELYQVLTENLSDLFFRALTTQHTGVFILVKK